MNQLSPKRMFTKKLTAFHQTLPITTQQANSLLEKADRALQSFMAEKSNSYLMVVFKKLCHFLKLLKTGMMHYGNYI